MNTSPRLVFELIEKYDPCWPTIEEIRVEARKKGIWKEVKQELKRIYRKKMRDHRQSEGEKAISESEKIAAELVQTFLYSDSIHWGMADLRKETKKKGK